MSKVVEANGSPEEEVAQLIANWTFSKNDVYEESGINKIKDLSLNEFVGELKNGASVRTIGETAQMNVLDLGSNNGYFDMGADFGEALVSLNDYTMGAFVRIDAEWASKIGSNGNFLWSLSNDSLQGTAANGYIIAKMNTLQNCITNTNWSNEQTPPVSEEDDCK